MYVKVYRKQKDKKANFRKSSLDNHPSALPTKNLKVLITLQLEPKQEISGPHLEFKFIKHLVLGRRFQILLIVDICYRLNRGIQPLLEHLYPFITLHFF